MHSQKKNEGTTPTSERTDGQQTTDTLLLDEPISEQEVKAFRKHSMSDNLMRDVDIYNNRCAGKTFQQCGDEAGISRDRARQVFCGMAKKVKMWRNSEKLIITSNREDILEASIYDVAMPVRIRNAVRFILKKHSGDAPTMRDAIKLTQRQLISTQNVGRKSMEEFEQVLRLYGLEMKGNE